jgi:uncharacterized protein YifN (PemK superfamily)
MTKKEVLDVVKQARSAGKQTIVIPLDESKAHYIPKSCSYHMSRSGDGRMHFFINVAEANRQ